MSCNIATVDGAQTSLRFFSCFMNIFSFRKSYLFLPFLLEINQCKYYVILKMYSSVYVNVTSALAHEFTAAKFFFALQLQNKTKLIIYILRFRHRIIFCCVIHQPQTLYFKSRNSHIVFKAKTAASCNESLADSSIE